MQRRALEALFGTMDRTKPVPVTYRIDHKLRTVLSSAYGVLTEADIQLHKDGLSRDLEFDPTYNHLYDMLEVTEVKLSVAFTKNFARQSLFGKTSKRAFVTSLGVTVGIVNVFRGWHQAFPDKVEVFSTVDEAWKWLNLP